jgi:hypothetical protein
VASYCCEDVPKNCGPRHGISAKAPKCPQNAPRLSQDRVYEDAAIGPVTHPGLDGDWRLRLAAFARLKELADS